MKIVIGVDLGSTTSKALVMDETGAVVGKGITNSRSNYEVAVDVARSEALIQTRLNGLAVRLRGDAVLSIRANAIVEHLTKEFRKAQYRCQLECLIESLRAHVP